MERGVFAELKGRRAEKKLKRVLELLKKKHLIVDYLWTSPDELLDKQGKDFAVVVIDSEKSRYTFRFLDAKSSRKGVEIFLKKQRQKYFSGKKPVNPDSLPIPVEVNLKEADYSLMQKVIKLLNLN